VLDFRYRRLGYVAINVSDAARSRDFYTQIVGLQAAGEAHGGEWLMRCTSRHHDVVLHEGHEPGLRRVAWEMESAGDLERVRAHLVNLELTIQDVADAECAALGISDAFRISEPITGATFEYYHSMRKADSRFAPTVTKIERLGHVVVGTPKFDDAEQYFTEQLNFRASDRMKPAVFWMRCFPNPLHHSFAIGRAQEGRLNHVNFMVTDIDDIGKALWRLKKHDVPIVFGPGRHPPSESIFLYFLDPDRLTVEFSFGMEEFPEEHARGPRDLTLSPESIDYWGAEPGPGFGAVGEIEPLGV